jgi:WD40 repeat protein
MKILTSLIALVLAGSASWADPTPQLPHRGDYEQYVELSANGQRVSLDEGTAVWVWNTDTRQLLRKMQGFVRVTCVEFSPDGKSLVVGDYPRWLGCFDCRGPLKKLWEFRGVPAGQKDPQSVAGYEAIFSPNGQWLLLLSAAHGRQPGDPVVRLLDARSGKVCREFAGWGGSGVTSRDFAFSADSQGFARAAHDKLQYFTIPDGRKASEIRLGGTSYGLEADPDGVLCTHQVEGGRRTVSRLYRLPQLTVASEKSQREEAPANHPQGSLSWMRQGDQLAVLKDGQSVWSGSSQDMVRSWVAGGGFLVASPDKMGLYDSNGKFLTEVDRFIRCNRQSTLGLTIQGYGSPAEVIDLVNGRRLAKLDFASSCDFSADGRRAAINLKKGILIVDVPASLEQGRLVTP